MRRLKILAFCICAAIAFCLYGCLITFVSYDSTQCDCPVIPYEQLMPMGRSSTRYLKQHTDLCKRMSR
jgi:hypothetical protein